MGSKSRTSISADFVCRDTAAGRCEISTGTWDLWVRDGFVPPAAFVRGQIKRWHWPSVEQQLLQVSVTETDPFMQGVANAEKKARERRAP